jgi:hypothetical protein
MLWLALKPIQAFHIVVWRVMTGETASMRACSSRIARPQQRAAERVHEMQHAEAEEDRGAGGDEERGDRAHGPHLPPDFHLRSQRARRPVA